MPEARGSTHLLCGEIHVRTPGSDDEAIGRLATRQGGIVGRGQLLDLEVGQRAIDHRLSTGRLRRLHRGVYSVGHEAVPFPGRVRAAVMTTAPGAAASHLNAAAVWGMADPPGGPVHVTATQSRRPRRGVVIHRGMLPADDLECVEGIPVTSVARTLLDLSGSLGPSALRRLVKQAEFLGLADWGALAAILARYPRRRGRRALAEIVESGLLGAGRTRSEFEDRFLEFCRKYRLPMPDANVVLEVRGQRLEVDCVWRDARVVVELDGYGAHGRRLAFHRDRARDRALIAAGWVPMRVTWSQLHLGEASLATEIRDTLASRRELLHGRGSTLP